MVPLTKSLFSLSGRSICQIVTRQAHRKTGPDFHDKYGNAIFVGGLAFCVAVWSYVATQTGLTWNVSPICKITPQNWREDWKNGPSVCKKLNLLSPGNRKSLVETCMST
ncbi:cytochrome c oxidase subunit 7B, mitochondrial-like [Carcharodon carcharias]|uniref:cytochrome c oxidase subunit 7B, mitochondrial-like n=1 Tax=Carcharodon carcharias TaxID=13397 RepID=UPI001B7F0893|nr:cytochrome c oxidase subunit 7B, mitochondrial-like [Carcharodon carcharias]